MTFAAPLFAWLGGAAAAAVIGLHLLAWRRPPETPLPTARFAPERPIRMVSRAVRPVDLLLLALRAGLVLLAGFALAGPRFEQRRAGSARVVVADRSSALRSGEEAIAAVRRELRTGDALIVFDSVAREIEPAALDSAVQRPTSSPGALSPALVAAIRSARRLENVRDTVEIVVVSPFAPSEIDAATASIRSLWTGAVRRVRVAGAANSVPGVAVPESSGDPSDGVVAAVTLNGAVGGGGRVRVIRDALSAADSASAREGRTIVFWPKLGTAGWPSRARTDTAMAVTAFDPSGRSLGDNATVVASFTRAWSPPAGRAIARWADGEPAATETPLGSGCIRAVAIDVPSAGDLALTTSFRRFTRRLTEPCGGVVVVASSDSALDRAMPTTVSASQAASVGSSRSEGTASRLTAWLLALALALALVEQFVRRRGHHARA